jgi:Ankyrin repeats (3 copies)
VTNNNANAGIWESARSAIIEGDAAALERLLNENSELLRKQHPPPYVTKGPGPNYQKGDARSIIAREHHFESWEDFEEYAEARKREGSAVARFEAAVDAIIAGDASTLERLLREDPELIRARSTRRHHATLLHYLGSNGIEGFREKTPKNAVEITEMLLKAGCEVDAEADMYGGGATTLGLVATSIHPELAGVQEELMQCLLDHGAAIDHPRAGGNDDTILRSCLYNGRPRAAEFLVARGAYLDLETAAGVGRIDIVKSFFNEDGSVKSNATKRQMEAAFTWACMYNRKEIIVFLLEQGVNVGAQGSEGETGLHWAAHAGNLEIVELLLAHQAPFELKNSYGGTVLGQALWSAFNAPQPQHLAIVETLIAAGAKVKPDWKQWIEKLRAREGANS